MSQHRPPISVTLEFDPEEMSRRGRIGAHVMLSRNDPRETTAAARAAFRDAFLTQVDPDGVLPLEERERRAAHARKAHFQRLARLSAISRGKKTAAVGAAAGEEAA